MSSIPLSTSLARRIESLRDQILELEAQIAQCADAGERGRLKDQWHFRVMDLSEIEASAGMMCQPDRSRPAPLTRVIDPAERAA